MATKRQKRIDPNAAFASIVGAEPQPEEAPAAAQPEAAGEGEAVPEAAPAPKPVAVPAGTAAAEPPAPPTAAPAKNIRKLVQKGYYLYDDQAKQLAVYAAVTGADKSSIVRAALSEYFDNHPAG